MGDGNGPAYITGKNFRNFRIMKTLLIFFFFLLLSLAPVAAQNQEDAYTVPSIVYVGDRASLILPLPGTNLNEDTIIVPPQLPLSSEIDIHRAALERRPGGSRLTIEFTAFTPGMLELPPLEIEGEIFTGITIVISSILEKSESGYALSGPAPPPVIPGTSFLVYGTIFTVIFFLLAALWILFHGRRQINQWLAAWKLRRLLIAMLNTEKRLRKSLTKESACREILDTLSVEFRDFLGFFTGENCRSMTAEELGRLAPQRYFPPGFLSGFLGDFFGRCDNIRFSGRSIGESETLAMLGNVRSFLVELGGSMRKKPQNGEAA